MFVSIHLTVAIILALLSLAPLLRVQHWLIRGLDFPRLQLTVVLVFWLLMGVFYFESYGLAESLSLALLAITLARQLRWIIPYTRFFPVEVESTTDQSAVGIKIMTANVLTPNRNSEQLIRFIKHYQPDVIITLESDSWWQQQLAVIEDVYAYTVKVPLDNLYGMHLYSRLPLHNSQVRYIVEDDKPSIHTWIELASGQRIKAHFVHPAPPSPSENEASTERDAELLLLTEDIDEEHTPTIVAGDLNDVAWSRTTLLFRKMSGLLDPRIGRGMFNTFHADYWFARWPLDHIFHSHHFALVNVERLPAFGSDHFPLLTELALKPELNSPEDAPDPDAADEELARNLRQEA